MSMALESGLKNRNLWFHTDVFILMEKKKTGSFHFNHNPVQKHKEKHNCAI